VGGRRRSARVPQDSPAASMRPRRARLGCPPPYNPLGIKAISWGFRAIARHAGRTCQILHAVVLTMSKSPMIPTDYRDSSGYGVPGATTPLERTWRLRNTFDQGRPSFRQLHVIVLYDDGSPFDFREQLADALHCQLDFICWSDIDQENMVLSIFHQFTQSRLQLSTAAP
jgi:hypothetical protein